MKILNELGMDISNKGYKYWEEAVKISGKSLIMPQMYNIYEKISKKYNTTPMAVERCMRYSISKIEELNKKINLNYKINNKRFFAYIIRGEFND